MTLSRDKHPQSIGPYRIIAPLGHGSMGIVYRVEHSETGEEFALKTIRIPNVGKVQSMRREIHSISGIMTPGF